MFPERPLRLARGLAFALIAAGAMATVLPGSAAAHPSFQDLQERRVPRPSEDQVARVTKVLVDGLARSDASARSVALSLSVIGAEGLPAVWHVLWGTETFPEGATPRSPAVTPLAVLEVLIGELPRRRVNTFFSDLLVDDPDPQLRLWLMGYLRKVGTSQELPLVLAMGCAKGNTLAEPFERTLVDLLRRDPASFALLRRRARLVRAPYGTSIVAAVEEVGTRRGLEVLATLFGTPTTPEHRLLEAVAVVAERLSGPFDSFLVDNVRRYLDLAEPEERIAAARALGALGDEGSVPALIGLLDQADPRLSGAAQESLGALTRLHFGPSARRWSAWYRDETTWWAEEAPEQMDRLRSDDPAEVAAAISNFVPRRLNREVTVEELVELLDHLDANVRRLACLGLRELRSDTPSRALVARLRDDDPAVREAAHESLIHILNHDLPAEPDSWTALLDRRDSERR